MITRQELIEQGLRIGFEDVGFTTADAFESQREILLGRQEEYGWAEKAGLGLLAGTDPKTAWTDARSIIVLVDLYFREAFPRQLEASFGRCCLDDGRVTGEGLSKRVKAFRALFRQHGIDSKVPFNLPIGPAAARAPWARTACSARERRGAARGSFRSRSR